MMIKKKRHSQDEEMQNSDNNTTDYKEDNVKTAGNGNETPSGDKATEPPSAGKPGEAVNGQVSDNVVTDERKLEEKLAEMQDRYLRLSAEFDNYRKRTLREKMDLSKYAGENIFKGILPLMDDFDRALSHMDTTTDCEAMKNGLELIHNKFSEFLRQNGVKEIESLNLDFNVDMHEAVAKVPAENEEKKGKVIDVVSKGYYLQDKVLRFAKVVVGD